MKKKRNAFLRFLTFRWGVILPVKFYRRVISPHKTAMCIYTPSCSAYMLEAVSKFGLIKGAFLGIKRILRCVPWEKGGFDPVPDNPKGDMKWLF